MSAHAHRTDRPLASDSEWLEVQDSFEISAASVWALDYDEEITIQSKRVAAEQHQQLTAGPDDEPSVGETRPEVPMLDESQVLPSEASFATVKLHQQFDAQAVTRGEQPASRAIEESTVNGPRTRTLDVSQILPGEVSYATVMLHTGDRHYSPFREFFATSNLDWRKIAVEALLLVLICSAIAIYALKVTKPGFYGPNQAVSNSADTPLQTEPAVVQTELPTSTSEASAGVRNLQIQADDHRTSGPENDAKLEAEVEAAPSKISAALISQGSSKTAADEIKLKTPHKIPQQEGKSRTRDSVAVAESSKPARTAPQTRPSVKESEGSNKRTPTEKAGVNNTRAETVGARRESSVPTNPTSEQPKVAPASAPVTGGGQRPRTVTPRANP